MIPQSWPSRIEEVELLDDELEVVDTTKYTVYKVVFLEDTYGLTQWIDYIPVQQELEPDNVNSYGENDAIMVEEFDGEGQAFIDYIPVYEEGTVKWSADNDGYIPVFLFSEG